MQHLYYLFFDKKCLMQHIYDNWKHNLLVVFLISHTFATVIFRYNDI